jgi:hypothetical protein
MMGSDINHMNKYYDFAYDQKKILMNYQIMSSKVKMIQDCIENSFGIMKLLKITLNIKHIKKDLFILNNQKIFR